MAPNEMISCCPWCRPSTLSEPQSSSHCAASSDTCSPTTNLWQHCPLPPIAWYTCLYDSGLDVHADRGAPNGLPDRHVIWTHKCRAFGIRHICPRFPAVLPRHISFRRLSGIRAVLPVRCRRHGKCGISAESHFLGDVRRSRLCGGGATIRHLYQRSVRPGDVCRQVRCIRFRLDASLHRPVLCKYSKAPTTSSTGAPPRRLSEILKLKRLQVAIFTGMVSYASMSFVMTATPSAWSRAATR